MIRAATLADVETLVVVGRIMHAESPAWSRFGFSETKVGATLRQLIVSAHGLVLVAEVGGLIVGGIVAHAASHWSCDDLVAYEMALFVLPDHRGGTASARLVKWMSEWAYETGCVAVHVGCSTGVDDERHAQLYEALGYTRTTIGLERWYGSN